MSFRDPLQIEALPDGKHWKVLKSFSFYIGHPTGVSSIDVPAGFVTDGATIPRLFWRLVGHPLGRYAQSAVLHDYLYSIGTYPRKECDVIFYESMQCLGVPWWKRKLMYRGVRLGGWHGWNKYRKKEALK